MSALVSPALTFCLYLIVILQGEQGEPGVEGKRGMDGPPGIKVPLTEVYMCRTYKVSQITFTAWCTSD